MMDERHLHKIREHFKDEEARQRIRQNIERGHSEATVTIGRAARISGFSESQLRDWEKSGLLKPQRPKEGGDGYGGQRQYSFTELEKLAIIRELIDEANMSPGSIPSNIDEIWREIETTRHRPSRHSTQPLPALPPLGNGEAAEYIDRRVSINYSQHLSWRYYASRALWLSLMLIHEEVSVFQAGLVLPFHDCNYQDLPKETERLSDLGPALVGWLGQTRSFYTFLTQTPGFEYSSDYSILPLCSEELYAEYPASPVNQTMIIVVRGEEKRAHRNREVVNTVRQLLEPLYEDRAYWASHFGETMYDLISPSIDFTAKVKDAALTGLANWVIRLGGKNARGEDRWSSCNILLPENTHLPLYQHSLIVRAKSRNSRVEVGKSTVLPERHEASLSLRAYQGGHIIYRSQLAAEDITPLFVETEGPIKSNIALPIGGETGKPLGVLYIASYEPEAFTIDDQRVLRIMARIIEELLNSYNARRQVSTKLVELLRKPGAVDPLFQEFATEADFFADVEALLMKVPGRLDYQEGGDGNTVDTEISFIAIDIEARTQERISHTYGDQVLRKLNKEIGARIRDLLPTLFANYLNCKLYHIYGGRYYIFLRGFSLDNTRFNATRLCKVLRGNMTIKQSDLPGGTLLLQDIALHLGVTYYALDKLKDFFITRQNGSVSDISRTLYHALNSALKLGVDKEETIIAWDPDTRTLVPYPCP